MNTIDKLIWRYLGAGLSVIPVSEQNKRALGEWKQYQSHLATSVEVDTWLENGLQSMAVICGAVSGGLEILDFDDNSSAAPTPYSANDFWYPFRDAAQPIIDQYQLPIWRTGGGGYQLAYRCEQVEGNLKLAWVPDDTQLHGRSIAIETRGEGGYALVPPSLHPSGLRYEMLSGDLASVPTIPVAAREALLQAAKSLDLMPYTKNEVHSVRTEARHGRQGTEDSVIDAFNERHQITDLLSRYGYTEGYRGRYSRPGQPDSMGVVVLIADNISFHWSSNDPLHRVNGTGRPLPVDPFNVHCDLGYAGDVRAATKAAAAILGMAKRIKQQPVNSDRQTDNTELFSDLLTEMESIDPDELESWAIDQAANIGKLDNAQQAKLFVGLHQAGLTKTFTKNTLAKLITEAQPQAPNINSEGTKQADRLMTLIEERAQFFTGSDGGLYASVAVGEHRECHRLNGGAFNEYLSKLFYDECKTVVGAQARADAKSVMAFMAREHNEQVFTRVGMGENERVYIDLGTPDWSAIEVDANGWRVVQNPPIHFRRASSALPLVMPTPSTDIAQLAIYLNIEDDQWPLVAAFAVATLYPKGPYPILGLQGEHGTAKSTTLRVLKALLDPSAAALRSQPDQIRDLMIAGSNSWLMAFDNVSSISPEMADAMCRISTGGGFSSRANYTDGDEHIIDIMRPQAVNGIGDIFTRGDLIDRTIVINPPVIPEAKRQPEKIFWEQFDRDKSALLGALLHGLSVGIKNLPTVELKEKPRMADFAQFAIAAEPAYNDGGQYPFIEIYMENREEGVSALLESSPLARIVWDIVKIPGQWSGTSRKLYEKIIEHASEEDRKNKTQFPTAENRLKNMLQRIAPAMRKRGIDIRYGRGKKGASWTIKRLTSAGDGSDGGDGQNT